MEKASFELTNAQKSIWLISQMYPKEPIENICGSITIPEKVNFIALQKAANRFVQQNDGLRLRFKEENGVVKQYVHEYVPFKIELVKVHSKEDVTYMEKQFVSKTFDIMNQFLFEFEMFEFEDGHGGLTINAHHLIFDAWTTGLAAKEIMEHYAYFMGMSQQDEENTCSYLDYIHSEAEYLASERFKKDEEYWNDIFQEIPEIAKIPDVKSKDKTVLSCVARRKQFYITKQSMQMINDYCSHNRISIFNFFMAVYAVYVGKLTGLEEFVFGSPILNRTTFKEKHTAGMFISTMPFKITIRKDYDFSYFVNKIAKDSMGMLRHQKYPYQFLLENLRSKSPNLPNLYDILISYQNTRMDKQDAKVPYDAKWTFNGCTANGLEIHLHDLNDTGGLAVAYDYAIARYDEEEISRIHARILHMIDQIMQNHAIPINKIEIVTPEEKRMLLEEFNCTENPYDKNKTVVQLFEEQVQKTPNEIALVFGDASLTYQELNQKVNALANYLKKHNVGKGSIVGIMVSRSLEMIVAMLGVLKVGATYVPIDPEYPTQRISYMLENSNAQYLLQNKKLQQKIDFPKTILVDLEEAFYQTEDKNNPEPIGNSQDPMYIIYTSGSTGMPKGVILTHKNIVNFILGTSQKIHFKGKTIASVTTISFDIFVLESFLALACGAKIVIANEEEQTGAMQFNKMCIKHHVNMIQTTPSRLEAFLKGDTTFIKNMTEILVGGEPFPITLLKQIQSLTNAKIYNLYGPTETAVWSTICELTHENQILIGKPIANTKCFILAQDQTLLPPRMPGTLYIGGDGVSKGYLKNEELTHQKFIANPYGEGTIYNTNDLAYYTLDGNLIHLGRSDNQVKINGYRIELGEIENAIHSFDGITNVVVKAIKLKERNVLIAYYIAKHNVNIVDLKQHLHSCLPQYMVPHFFIQMEQFPYTPNGKIDRKSLPLPKENEVSHKAVPPRNKTDEKLIRMLEEILHQAPLYIYDSFFEIGGDSLSAIHLCTKIYEEFQVQISVKEVFENPILLNLSDLIASKNMVTKEIKIEKAEKAEYYPTTFAQRRMYYATKKITGHNVVYNLTGGIFVKKLLNTKKIEQVLQDIIATHQSLRTQFELVGVELMQKVMETVPFSIAVEYVKNADKQALIDKFQTPFDLEKAPLFRAKVYVINNEETLILLDTHHIIMDGASLNLLIEEFCKRYNDEEITLPEKEYVDYAVWENQYIKDKEALEDNKIYWETKLKASEIPALNLPYDYPATNQNQYQGDKITHVVPETLWEEIMNCAKQNQISAYTVFLSALYLLLYKYTGQTNLLVASPISGRHFAQTARIIGMFVNNLLLKTDITANETVEELLQNTQNMVSESISHQPYPYELMTQHLNLADESSLMDVVLTYQNNPQETTKIDGQKIEAIVANSKTSKFNIWIEVIPTDKIINLEYNTARFKKETIDSFVEHYIFMLEQMVAYTKQKLDDVEIITPKEEKILQKFNQTEGEINDDTIASIFEQTVEKHKNDIALICEDKILTYAELNERANSLAHLLIERGIGKNDIVCIMTNRSLETVVCMLAILKAGAAFFNVDPTYPIERTKYYIEDSQTRYVLTQTELKQQVKEIENCIEIDLNKEEIYGKNRSNPKVKIDREDLSYLIYTSGSTGQPKGVMLNQVGLANMTKAMTKVLDYLKGENKHCLVSVTSTPFDIFVYEIVVSLTHGLKVVMANNAEHRNPKLLDDLIKKYHVDVMTVTPSLMKINYDNRQPDTALANVKNMVFGGEPLPEKFVADLKALADDITIYNIYGPSEITILSNVQNLEGETEITTGPPIMNTQIHILDKNQKRVPIGVTGEIYIAGIQVGCGYRNKPELTKERFLPNPFGPGKMYKSGDIGRWTFDGKVQCLGRIDHQIKLRGLRIELGEIENVLLNIEGITSAVVNKIELDGKEFLCGYYVSEREITETEIKENLRKDLPPYMIPTYFVKLEQMPYTINRKIDRKALPLPNFDKPVVNSKINISALSTEEEKLLQIWKNILKNEDIDIDDNFFDIGGDSVAAISMQIEAVKYGLEFEYSDIFTFPTIRKLCEKSRQADTSFVKNYDMEKINQVLQNNTVENLATIQPAKVNNILLIGSTGYLGAHILDSFLKNQTGIAYCLIRRKNNIDIKQRLKDTLHFYFGNRYDDMFDRRIKIIMGDIVLENLGLSKQEEEILQKEVDVVINSGAIVKHFGLKKKFYDINVTGTKNIIALCTKLKKRLLHISTISVSGNGEKEETVIETPENKNNKIIFKESDIEVGQNIKGVYTTTKYEAELCVLEAIAKGLDAQILRLGNITNRYVDGVFQSNVEENAFAKRIKSFIEIGAFPKYMLQHAIELTPVDLAAEAIIKILNHKSICNVFHIYNTKLLEVKLLVDTINQMGLPLLPVPEIMMKDILTGILADDTRKDILSGIIYDLDESKRLIYTSNIRLNAEFTEAFLRKLDFEWKPIDKDYIMRYMNYFEKIKFIKKEEIEECFGY